MNTETTADEREAFEAWAKSDRRRLPMLTQTSYGGSIMYSHPDTQLAWDVWTEARAAQKPAHVEAVARAIFQDRYKKESWDEATRIAFDIPDGKAAEVVSDIRSHARAAIAAMPQASELTEDALKLMAVEFRKERKARLGFESEADADLRSMKVAYRALRATSGAEEVK